MRISDWSSDVCSSDLPVTINLSRLLADSLLAFEELTEMKSIILESDIQDNVNVALHPALADILINNLISNSIRHNYPQGHIRVTLTGNGLLVSNTGDELKVDPPEDIFKRFKKSDQSTDSIGLGLAIVDRKS